MCSAMLISRFTEQQQLHLVKPGHERRDWLASSMGSRAAPFGPLPLYFMAIFTAGSCCENLDICC